MAGKTNYSEVRRCGHCANRAPMVIESSVSKIEEVKGEGGGPWSEGDTYQLLLCPSCGGMNLVKYYWHDGYMEGPEDAEVTALWPGAQKTPPGLPKRVEKAYEAAQAVKHIDVNAYAVLLRRLLEIVCQDRKATGRVLADQLRNLASRGEIPDKLLVVAAQLKDFGNVGAHAGPNDLGKAEVPLLDALVDAVIEYVYSAPNIVRLAEARLVELKAPLRKKSPK